MTESQTSTAVVSLPTASVLPALVIVLTLVAGLYNSLAVAFGYGFPFDTFVFSSGDLLADFVKSALSYPGPEIQRIDAWPALYRAYFEHNPYGGAAALAEGKLSNLHGMPLPTLLLLEARRAFAVYDPNLVVTAFFATAVVPFCVLIWTETRKSRAGATTVLAYLLSYPLLFAVTRGNITAIMLGEALATATLLVWHGRHLWLVAVLLAFAIDLRPNAALLLALPLLSWSFRHCLVAGAVAMAMAAAIFWASLAAAHHLYPDYTLANFYRALLVYGKDYAVGDAGLAYGSSLLGGLKLVGYVVSGGIPPAGVLELAGSLLGLASIGLWLVLAVRGRLERTEGLFTLLAIYALFSGVFGDYHLIVFFAFIVIFAQEGHVPFATGNARSLVIAMAVLIVLAPKNYVFWHGLSAQIVINPLVLVLSVAGIGAAALMDRREAKERQL